MTLDGVAFADDGFVPDLVKLDVEGRELHALEGAGGLLADRRPHLIVETHSEELEHDCLALLRTHGYAPRIVHPRRVLAEVRAGHNRWLIAAGERPTLDGWGLRGPAPADTV